MITYKLGDALYLNITNRCTNHCDFCIRQKADGVGGYELWLKEEPTTRQVIEEMGDLSSYSEVVFCGYGEPLMRLQAVLDISKYIKGNYPNVPIRINTNGQANLIYQEDVTVQFEGLADTISISLNAENAEKYQEICKSEYGEDAYYSILEFARKCKNHVPRVLLTVVDLPQVNLDKCHALAKELGVELKVRPYWDSQNN